MRIAIVGSREFPKLHMVREYIDTLGVFAVIVSGGAIGVDREAERYGEARGHNVVICKANWGYHGKKAGFLRNEVIVDVSDRVVAFWDGKSKGTKATIDYANSVGKPVSIIYPSIVLSIQDWNSGPIGTKKLP